MVVGQTPHIVISAGSPPLHFSTRMCSLPATAQGYQNGATINCSTVPVTSVTPTQYSSPLTPPNSAPNSPTLSPVSCNQFPINNNGFFTYTPLPTNSYSGIPVVPINSTVTMPCKVPDNQFPSPVTNIIPFNPSIYSCPQPLQQPTIIPYQPRLVNGTILQCTPGLCQFTVPSENVVDSVTSNVVYNSSQLYNIPPYMSIAQTICSTNVVSPWKQSYGMEHVWRKEFDNLFYKYTEHSQHVWTLLPVTGRPGGIWYENVDSAKVRFCCIVCSNGWTSMKGRVAFWFILNHATNEGVVCLKLYGQQCDRCKRGDYEPAMWYPEEVLKVIVNIYNKVGQVYYGFTQAPYHKTRRPGKPRTAHNSNLCQACKDGVCSERR